MDDRSRKLLSSKALPKAKLPEPKPHQKREFRLPECVTPPPRASSPRLDALRAKALGAGVKLADGSNGTVKLPGMPPAPSVAPSPPPLPPPLPPVQAVGELKWPALGTPAQPFPPAPQQAALLPVPAPAVAARPAGKPGRKPPAASVPPPAAPVPPPLNLKKKAAAPESRAKSPKLVPYDHMPDVPAAPMAAGKRAGAPVVIGSDAPSFREATTMWFRAGDEEAARAVREAEADAMERAEQTLLSGFSRMHALLAVAGGIIAILVIIALM